MPLTIHQIKAIIDDTIDTFHQRRKTQTLYSILLFICGVLVIVISVIYYGNENDEYSSSLLVIGASMVTATIPIIVKPVHYSSKISRLKIVKQELSNVKDKDDENVCKELANVLKELQ